MPFISIFSQKKRIPGVFLFGLTKHLLAEESMAAEELFDNRLLYFLTRSVTIPDVNFLLQYKNRLQLT